MDLKSIDNGIRGIRSSRANYVKNTQTLGLAIIRHAKEHGDCSRALYLVRALGKKEQQQMIKWFAAFSPIKVTLGKTPKDDKYKFAERDAKTYNDFNIDGATAVHWLDFEKPKASPKEFNLNSFRTDLQKLLKRYETLIKDGKCDDGEDVVNDIRAFRDAAADRGKAKPTPVSKQFTDLAEEALAASSWGVKDAA